MQTILNPENLQALGLNYWLSEKRLLEKKITELSTTLGLGDDRVLPPLVSSSDPNYRPLIARLKALRAQREVAIGIIEGLVSKHRYGEFLHQAEKMMRKQHNLLVIRSSLEFLLYDDSPHLIHERNAQREHQAWIQCLEVLRTGRISYEITTQGKATSKEAT